MRSLTASRSGWFVALGLALLLTLSLVSPAVGGPRFLTLGQAKKVYLTKKVATNTYLRKGAATGFLPVAGDTRAPVAPGSWVLADDDDPLVVNYPYATAVVSSGLARDNVDVFAPVPVATMVNGTTTSVVGIEVCYVFSFGAQSTPILDRITLQSASTAVVATSLTNLFADETGRTDNACTTVRFDPVPLGPNDAVGIGLRFDFPDANTQVRVGRGSLILAR